MRRVVGKVRNRPRLIGRRRGLGRSFEKVVSWERCELISAYMRWAVRYVHRVLLQV